MLLHGTMTMSNPHIIISVKHVSQVMAQTHVIKEQHCSIGRAWDNDIVITDSKCPLQLGVITNDNGNLSIQYSHFNTPESPRLLQSGDELQHKHSNTLTIKVYLSNHPAPGIAPQSPIELFTGWLSKPLVAIVATFLYLAVKLWNSVQSQVRLIEWQNIIDGLVMETITALFVVVVLTAITKFSKQEKRFFTYLSITSLFFVVHYAINQSFDVFYFNIPLAFLIFTAAIISSLLLVAVASRLMIGLMTNWSNASSWILAILLGALSLYYNYGQHWLRNDKFSQSPKIITKMYPGFYKIVPNSSVDEFLEASENLFDKVDKLKTK